MSGCRKWWGMRRDEIVIQRKGKEGKGKRRDASKGFRFPRDHSVVDGRERDEHIEKGGRREEKSPSTEGKRNSLRRSRELNRDGKGVEKTRFAPRVRTQRKQRPVLLCSEASPSPR